MPNGLKEKEKEKKQKLKQLEADIKEMKRDHKETFEAMTYPSLSYVKPTQRQVICAAAGIIIMVAAGLWLHFNAPEFDRYAVFRLGNLRFTRSIFFLPLVISSLMLIIGKWKRTILFSFIPDAAVAVIGSVVSIKTELLNCPIWVYVIMYCLVFTGTALFIGALLCYRIHKEKVNNTKHQ
ncbi:MAG: hypothetical protein ACI4I1_03255 [Oscillospiraceae bacterium]